MQDNNDYIIKLESISKSFAGVLVLDNVTLGLRNHSVHALVGGNGAGKSTLMKILDGFHSPDSGHVVIDNRRFVFRNPAQAHSKDIYLVPQEPRLFPHMTVLENIELGSHQNRKELKKKSSQILSELNCTFKLESKAEDLAIANQQLVEIIKGLVREAKVLIFDEPTSALSFQETEELFAAIKKILVRPKIGVFYITHRLPELPRIADEVTVLKDGRVVTHGPIGEFTSDLIVRFMVPEINKDNKEKEEAKNIQITAAREPKEIRDVILETEDLCGDKFNHISLTLHRGEILGLAGVIGAGRTELAETIFGLRKRKTGYIFIKGRKFCPGHPRDCIKEGLMYIPEDRHLHGIFQKANITDNVTSSILYRIAPIFLRKSEARRLSNNLVHRMDIKINSLNDILSSLSGGNQQKVVVAKSLAVTPEIIIMDEPTRGIDHGSRKDLYGFIENLAGGNVGIIIISSDINEIIELCDRVIVLHNGEIADVLEHEQVEHNRVIASAFGVKNDKQASQA